MRYLFGSAVGALAGYTYYYFIGCVSGSCSITSNALLSTLYCAVIGFLVSMIFGKKKIIEEKA